VKGGFPPADSGKISGREEIEMNRRELIKIAAAQTAMIALPAGAAAVSSSQDAQAKSDGKAETFTLRNAAFELELTPGAGLQCRMVHRPTGALLADGLYSYSFGTPGFVAAEKSGNSVTLHGSTAIGISVEHRFAVDPSGSRFEEQIKLSNTSLVPIDVSDARCGFVLPVPLVDGKASGPWYQHIFTAIPFRREPRGHKTQYTDISLGQILTGRCASELWTWETSETSAFASEGWAWTDGVHGLLFSKYSPRGLEFALLDRVSLAESKIGLRWGGFGIYRDNPEHGAWLLPGESHQFGVSRLTAFAGNWAQGFYAFRGEMEERGHGCPTEFNPPVHWNELYDNKLWWLPGDGQGDPEMRKKYYTLEGMKEEAAKAKEIGCEALYMDPGWDTNFGSKIWDEPRLGSYKSFTAMLAQNYGLKSSLHTPLSGWCDPSSYPIEAHRVDRYGKRLIWDRGFGAPMLCGASDQYVTVTANRLRTLAQDGAAFFMFDGTAYHAECWDPHHGHSVPARVEEHVQATCRLVRMVHADSPNVLIEMHDPVMGGAPLRAVPIYYGHGPCPVGEQYCQSAGFDTVWAFELMWSPMEDLLSGRAVALYYYNLAYSLPLYIHIDLRTDNQNALVFWWNASTCRHLGIGGTHPDAAVRKAQKDAMTTYRRLKRYFASGVFYGIDESTHVHSGIEKKSAVMNCFNLEKDPVEREIHFEPELLGLSPGKTYRFSDGGFQQAGSKYAGKVKIPPYGHKLIEIA
jgi:hypothetical protein